MIVFFKKTAYSAFALTTGVFTFVPESLFEKKDWFSHSFLVSCHLDRIIDATSINIITSRLLCLMFIWVILALAYGVFNKLRLWKTIECDKYTIRIEYGDILKIKDAKRVISFDECFNTHIGELTADINPDSLCGQYLRLHPDICVDELIKKANVSPSRKKSRYQNMVCYPSGTIVPNGNDLLLAFAKLDERGKGRFYSRDEYLECLSLFWKELERYYSEKDVCIPILGSGTTCFEDGSGASISQQDLLEMLICSYKLSSHKIKAPHKLRIVCKHAPNFSFDKIRK